MLSPANSSMTTLRTIAHALRGWPTPFGAALRISPDSFDAGGRFLDDDSAARTLDRKPVSRSSSGRVAVPIVTATWPVTSGAANRRLKERSDGAPARSAATASKP